ncbi:MAG: hypothetical protein U1F76_11345 [Candidatus Competibacteraceae bacterium]
MSNLSPQNDRLSYIRFYSAGSENCLPELWGKVGDWIFMALRDCSHGKYGFYILFMGILQAGSSSLAFIINLGPYCPLDPGEFYRFKAKKK